MGRLQFCAAVAFALMRLVQVAGGIMSVEEEEEGCLKDWYYDGVEDRCVACEEICTPCSNQSVANYCEINCNEYYIRTCKAKAEKVTEISHTVSSKHFKTIMQSDSRKPSFTASATSAILAVGSFGQAEGSTTNPVDHPSLNHIPAKPQKSNNDYNPNIKQLASTEELHVKSNSKDLLNNPLLWLSVVCLLIALFVTLTVVLLMFHYSTRSRRSEVPLINPGYFRSTSGLSSTSCSHCSERKCNLTMASEEHSGMLTGSSGDDTSPCHQHSLHTSGCLSYRDEPNNQIHVV